MKSLVLALVLVFLLPSSSTVVPAFLVTAESQRRSV
jgi:hypothetical protein